jgi:hypothetical protein
MGLEVVLWDAMTSDWSDQNPDRIVAHLARKIDCIGQRGRAAIVVLHDGGHLDPAANRAPSVAAADLLVARYKATHRFVTLDAWL